MRKPMRKHHMAELSAIVASCAYHALAVVCFRFNSDHRVLIAPCITDPVTDGKRQIVVLNFEGRLGAETCEPLGDSLAQ